MNQEQIKMGMKINKKINKKIAKNNNNNNNKHGPYDGDITKDLIDLGYTEGSINFNEMKEILNEVYSGKYRRLKKWVDNDKNVQKSLQVMPTARTTRFVNLCINKLREKYPNIEYNENTRKLEVIKTEDPSDDLKQKLDAVPINPTEIEQKEISKLKDEAIRLNKIKETVDDADEKKEKHEKTLKELSDKLEESQDEQREELNKKIKEKKEKKSVQKEDNLIDNISEMIRANKERKSMKTNDEESKISTANNKKLKEEIKNQLEIIKKAEPEEIKVKPKVKQEEITEPKLPVEKMVDRFRNTRHNIFTGDINQQMFMNFLTTIISDGKYADLLKEIRIKNEKYIDKKGTAIKEIQELMKNNNFLDVTHQCKLFERDLKDYMNNCFPDFKKGDELPINENQFRREIRNLIRRNISLGAHNQAKLQHSINKKLSKRGLPMISISGDRNGTINVGTYKAYERKMKEKSKGKIDTDPSNSKTFFSYDIHEIFNIIEKGLNNKLSTDAKNDIESIVKMETSNLINHANISHGASKIQNIIVEIERYLSSRMRNKSKSFKFTESNRYKLKELLSRFLNDKNGQE